MNICSIRERLKFCEVGILVNGQFHYKQPLSLNMSWDFHRRMNVKGVYLMTRDGENTLVCSPDYRSWEVFDGARLNVSFENLNIEGWSVEDILSDCKYPQKQVSDWIKLGF